MWRATPELWTEEGCGGEGREESLGGACGADACFWTRGDEHRVTDGVPVRDSEAEINYQGSKKVKMEAYK